MKALFGILFFIIIIPTPVYAANWEWIGDDDNLSIYLDKDSIQVEPNPQAKIVKFDCWIKNEYIEPTNEGIKYDLIEFEFKAIYKISNAYFRPRAYLCYDSDGNVLGSNSYEGKKWDKIPPDSKAEAIYRKVIECTSGIK